MAQTLNKMKLYLKSLELTNYRTFGSETLDIDKEITLLVGANESGKTNLLDALELLDVEKTFNDSDTKINSEYSAKNYEPYLSYRMELTEEMQTKLKRYARYFEKNNEVFINRNGSDIDDITVDTVNDVSYDFPIAYRNVSDVEQKLISKNGIVALSPQSYTLTSINYFKNSKLFKDGKVIKIEDKERNRLLTAKIKEIVLENMPSVFLWKYSDAYYIPKDVPIDFYNQKDKFQSVINLFKLGDIDEDKIVTHLTNRDSVYIINFLNTLSKKVSLVLNNTWKQRKNIKLNLHFKETWIEILVEEKDYQIDPNKRSEGLQWYLSFLINFRSKLQTLKNNIILFDQPGDKLHPGGQRDLMERFEEMAEFNQIVYSTHTPFTINKDYPERVRLITRPEDDSKIINRLSNREIFKDELLRSSLGLSLSDVSPVAEKNILVEGLLDKLILTDFIEKLKKFKFSIKLNQSVIIPAHSASKILYYANFIKSNGLDVLAIFDGDAAGKEAIVENKKKKVLESREILLVSLGKGTAQTIEDIIPIKIITDSINEIGVLIDKNKFTPIALTTTPVMPLIKGHFAKLGMDFSESDKHLFSIKVLEKFKKMPVKETDLKGSLSGLYELVKEIKKKL